MDEDKNVASSAPVAPQTDNVPEDTQDANVPTNAQPSSEADVVNGASKVQSDTTDTNWENDKRSMSEKIKALENEKNKYQDMVKVLEALDSAAAEDQEFRKVANRKLVEKGLLDESALADVTPQGDYPQSVPQGSPQVSPTVSPVLQWAEEKMREEREKVSKFFADYESRHPDLTQGTPAQIKANRTAIGAVAAKKIAEGVSQEEAYELAYKIIMNPSQLIEEGKLQGLAQAQSGIPAEGAAMGGSAKSVGSVQLTPEQRDIARRFGITEEAYAKRLEEE